MKGAVITVMGTRDLTDCVYIYIIIIVIIIIFIIIICYLLLFIIIVIVIITHYLVLSSFIWIHLGGLFLVTKGLIGVGSQTVSFIDSYSVGMENILYMR